jgi:hypothetical protein
VWERGSTKRQIGDRRIARSGICDHPLLTRAAWSVPLVGPGGHPPVLVAHEVARLVLRMAAVHEEPPEDDSSDCDQHETNDHPGIHGSAVPDRSATHTKRVPAVPL